MNETTCTPDGDLSEANETPHKLERAKPTLIELGAVQQAQLGPGSTSEALGLTGSGIV